MITTTEKTMPEPLEQFGPSAETFAFVVLAALPLVVMFRPWLRGHQSTRDVVMAGCFVLFVLYAVLSFKISLSAEGVRYRSPFGRPPLLSWPTIIRVRTGAKAIGRRTYPPYFMEIHTNQRNRPVIINIKFFSRRALSRLATLLCERAPQAELDDATRRLAKGKVPSVFFSS